MRKILQIILALLVINQVIASEGNPPKRELRACWIATVANIDWPSKAGLSVQQQKEEFVKLLDDQKAMGMNAVVVQVRPVADTFYPSEREPWSRFITGKQGIQPEYNPLDFMLEEAHKRNLEFHAWFNPYRAKNSSKIELSPEHPYNKHPEWFVEYGKKLYYNPGVPEAKEYVLENIMEVVRTYNIDAVHMDDYFYPYKIAGEDFPDSLTYEQYGKDRFDNIDDWRRDNVSSFVKELNKRIKEEKPYVKYGISPFGVWRNQDKDPKGSATQAGQTNYDDLYADVLLWVKEGWIDYVTPQLYWEIGKKVADYEILVNWWKEHGYGKHIYIGQGVYRVGNEGAWADLSELPRQLQMNRSIEEVNGSMYFSAKSLHTNAIAVADSLKNDYYRKPALVPQMPWLNIEKPLQAEITRIDRTESEVLVNITTSSESNADYFVVYRFEGENTAEMSTGNNILGTVKRAPYAETTFVDTTAEKGKVYTYVVTACNRVHDESSASTKSSVKVKKSKLKLLQ